MIGTYTDKQLLDRVASLSSFKGFPAEVFGVAIRSKEDLPDRFDDKLYLFKGNGHLQPFAEPVQFLAVYKNFTTNAGLSGLRYPQNPKGTAVLKSDEIYYDSWIKGMHRGKVRAWIQRSPLPVYRDKNRDSKSDETGPIDRGLFGINIHPSNYNSAATTIREFIGGWSLGCQVFGSRQDFNDFMKRTEGNTFFSYALLREF